VVGKVLIPLGNSSAAGSVSVSQRGDAMATDVVTADGRARVLADGNEIPLVGLGV
jgi:hypothetical protein